MREYRRQVWLTEQCWGRAAYRVGMDDTCLLTLYIRVYGGRPWAEVYGYIYASCYFKICQSPISIYRLKWDTLPWPLTASFTHKFKFLNILRLNRPPSGFILPISALSSLTLDNFVTPQWGDLCALVYSNFSLSWLPKETSFSHSYGETHRCFYAKTLLRYSILLNWNKLFNLCH